VYVRWHSLLIKLFSGNFAKEAKAWPLACLPDIYQGCSAAQLVITNRFISGLGQELMALLAWGGEGERAMLNVCQSRATSSSSSSSVFLSHPRSTYLHIY